MVFDFKRLLGRESGDADDYVEIDLGSAEPKEKKVVVKPFVLNKPAMDCLCLYSKFIQAVCNSICISSCRAKDHN